jgi:mono/diheme cytochrome c family protein
VALSAAILLGACSKEVKRGGALPVDTAAIMPTLDTTPATNNGAYPDRIDSMGGDSAGAALPPAAPSVVGAADSAAGDLVFHGKGRCFTCHGERGQGTPRLGPALSDSEWLAGNGSLASISDVITHGVAVPRSASVAMPAYGGMLTSREIALTAAYIYALSHPGSTVPDSASASGSARGAIRGATDSTRVAPSDRVMR